MYRWILHRKWPGHWKVADFNHCIFQFYFSYPWKILCLTVKRFLKGLRHNWSSTKHFCTHRNGKKQCERYFSILTRCGEEAGASSRPTSHQTPKHTCKILETLTNTTEVVLTATITRLISPSCRQTFRDSQVHTIILFFQIQHQTCGFS